MFDQMGGWAVAGAAGGSVLLLGLGALLLQAGCALADVAGPGFLKALLLFVVALAVCAPLGGLLVWFAGSYDPPSQVLGPARGLALAAALAGAWAVSALVYALSLAAPYRKGLVIAGAEMLLAALLGALTVAVVLVGLAVVQIVRQPPRPVAAAGTPAALAGARRS